MQLSDLYPQLVSQQAGLPVQISVNGNHIAIICRLKFNHKALYTGPDPDQSLSFADLAAAGIEQAWSGQFKLDDIRLEAPVTVDTRVIRAGRPAVSFRVRRTWLMPAHVISPIYRRIWGIFKTGQLESMGLNWSLRQPGSIIIPPGPDAGWFMKVAAHEAGHIFGLGDAYAASYRFYYAEPGTEAFMMHSNKTVQPREIAMLLQARASGRMQYFQRRWDSRLFLQGLLRDIRRLIHRARR